MALKTNNSAVAIAIQSVVDTFLTPTQPGDLMPVSNCRLSINGVTVANDEYTGSPFKNADSVAGKKVQLSYNVKLRPPGGTLPAANAFLIGRILQAAKFTEVRTATAIPAAAEAVAAGGTTTMAVLSTGAAATLDIYKGMALLLKALGTTFKDQLTAIRSYSVAKNAVIPMTAGAAITTGNYQIPTQLGYMRDVSSADPILISQQVWLDGHRYDLMNCRISGLQIVVPTSTRDQAAFPELQVTWDCMISANSANSTPSVASLGAIPLYKDGEFWLANSQLGSQTFTVDLGLQTESPPNPNKTDGSDAAEVVGGVAKVSMTRQKYLPATIDTLALADAQSNQSFFAQWGNGTGGGMVQIFVPDGRLDYQTPDTGGNIIMESGDLLIDALTKSVCITFPYGTAVA